MVTSTTNSDRFEEYGTESASDYPGVPHENGVQSEFSQGKSLRQADVDGDNAKSGATIHEMANVFLALSNPGRLATLKQLSQCEQIRVQELAERLNMRQPAVSQHLARLKADGLIAASRNGKSVIYRITDDRVGKLIALLEQLPTN